jgi:endoglucanase
MTTGIAPLKLFLALIAALASIAPVTAATFEGRAGISLDTWVTWPAESQWGDEKVLFPFPEWRKTVKASDLEKLEQTGFDFVRITVDPAPFLSEQSAALSDQLTDEVVQSVDLALGAGLSAIVDMHAIPAGDRSLGSDQYLKDQATFDAYLNLLRKIGASIKDKDPKRVAFELFNEPTIDCDSEGTNNWPPMMKQAFAAARASATKLTLVLSGACWGGAEGLQKMNAADFPDDNIIWSFHSYDPFILTHQGATWTGDFMPHVYGLPYPLHEAPKAELDKALDEIRARIKKDAPKTRRAGHLAYLDEEIAKIATKDGLEAEMDKAFKLAAEWAKKNGVDPTDITLGEFGMIRQEYGNPNQIPAKARAAFYRSQIDRAESYGFRWSAWSYGGAFGLVQGWNSEPVEPAITLK